MNEQTEKIKSMKSTAFRDIGEIPANPEVKSFPNTISEEYREQNAELHRIRETYGAGGSKHAPFISDLIIKYDIQTVMDYGCGKGELAKALMSKIEFQVVNYDPAIPQHSEDPADQGPYQLVTCTDVLEHIEPEHLSDVLQHIRQCAGEFIYLEIACRYDRSKTLPDGSNPHKIVKDGHWWKAKLKEAWPDLSCFSVLSYTRGNRVRFLVRF